MTGLTIKQELFAQRYVETGNASEAYRQAYGSKGKPETVAPNASRLLASSKVAARVEQLRAALLHEHKVTISSLLGELEEARLVGKGKGQAAAMVQATLGKARLAGLDKGDDPGDDDNRPAPVAVTVRVTDASRA